MRKHLIIPDTQVRPGVPTDHIDWVAEAIVEYLPDAIIHIGDHWDFPSLNQHDKPGAKILEGARYQNDLDAGNEAFARLVAPMRKEIARRIKNHDPRWNPTTDFCEGNHENRADRAVLNDPKWEGVIGAQNCDVQGFTRHRFLERLWIDGVVYAHYFQNSHSRFPIGGSVENRLNKVGASFVQGHEQGFRYGTRITGAGPTWHGVVCGSCYLHVEDYRGAQGQKHFRGIVVLNEVVDGDFCIMVLTLDYLCRKYTGAKSLYDYMTKKYPDQNWEHLKR